jgi:hypothetical protein
MYNYFLINNLAKEINESLPIFRNQFGYTMIINTVVAINEVYFYINFFNDKKEKLNINQLDRSYISFFINVYKDFVSSKKYKKSKGFFSKIKSDLGSVKYLISNKEFSLFAFFSRLGLPLFPFDKIYTYDGFDNRCLGKTLITVTKLSNIIYIDNSTSNVLPYYFHTLSLNILFDLYMIQNNYSLELIEDFLSYSRNLILSLILIFNIYLYLYLYIYQHGFTSSYLIWSFISVSIIPLSRWIPKQILYYIVTKNIKRKSRHDLAGMRPYDTNVNRER